MLLQIEPFRYTHSSQRSEDSHGFVSLFLRFAELPFGDWSRVEAVNTQIGVVSLVSIASALELSKEDRCNNLDVLAHAVILSRSDSW